MRIMVRGLDSVFFCGVQDTSSRALALKMPTSCLLWLRLLHYFLCFIAMTVGW